MNMTATNHAPPPNHDLARLVLTHSPAEKDDLAAAGWTCIGAGSYPVVYVLDPPEPVGQDGFP